MVRRKKKKKRMGKQMLPPNVSPQYSREAGCAGCAQSSTNTEEKREMNPNCLKYGMNFSAAVHQRVYRGSWSHARESSHNLVRISRGITLFTVGRVFGACRPMSMGNLVSFRSSEKKLIQIATAQQRYHLFTTEKK